MGDLLAVCIPPLGAAICKEGTGQALCAHEWRSRHTSLGPSSSSRTNLIWRSFTKPPTNDPAWKLGEEL